MRSLVTLAVALLLAAPTAALAEAGHEHHPGGAHAVEHSHQTAKAGGLEATFHFNAPNQALYTCPMHPDVTSGKPGTCPKCKMKLEKQTHRIGVQLVDAKKQPVKGAKVRLVIKDAHGMSQGLGLVGDGYYEGAFKLSPGKHDLTATVTRPGSASAVELKTTYVVK
jgi:hypothetical protein